MEKEDFDKIDIVFSNFIEKLPVLQYTNLNIEQKAYLIVFKKIEQVGQIITHEDLDYTQQVYKLVDSFWLTSNQEALIKYKNKSYPFGSRLFSSNSNDFMVLSNFQDHFIFIYKIKYDSIVRSINELEFLLKVFEQHSPKMAVNEEFGYLTMNPNYGGSAVSIAYFLNIEEKNEGKIARR